jgi:hypothetical protein
MDIEQRFSYYSKLKEQAHNKMENEVVEYTFIKNNAQVRTISGTRCPEIIAELEGQEPDIKDGINETNDMVVLYDVEEQGWRSFHSFQMSDESKHGVVVTDIYEFDCRKQQENNLGVGLSLDNQLHL